MNDQLLQSLVGNADQFPILRHWEFFNHAGVAPIPKVAADALRRFAGQYETVAYLNTGWYRDIETLRDLAGKLINAHRDEIAFVKNTSEGIATVAAGLDWKPGDRVVTTAVEYPANIYPWMDLANRFGVEVVMVPERTGGQGERFVPLDVVLQEAAHPKTRMVSLSHVEFASGQRHDIAAVGGFCRANHKLFCVDAIQTLGIVPVDVRAMNIDFLSADGHKWLLAPEGAGIFYVRKELQDQLRPLSVGWMNVINADDYGHYDYTLKPNAARYECGSHNAGGLLALKASLELLLSVGIGSVNGRIKALTDRLIAGLQSKGYQVISPRMGGDWSGIVSFTSARHDQKAIAQRLRTDHKTEIALREGRLRISPHFYNSELQIDNVIDHLPRN
jgi:cysteine desulfurase/selenocysteine lyase